MTISAELFKMFEQNLPFSSYPLILRLSTFFVALFLSLGGCAVSPPPIIERAEAGCMVDPSTLVDAWFLDADVRHPDDLDIVIVYVDIVDPSDGFYLGSVVLEEESEGYWSKWVESTEGFLDCDWPFSYGFRFVAEDVDGKYGVFSTEN